MSQLDAEQRGDLAEAMLPVAANLAAIVHGAGGPEDVGAALEGLSTQQKNALIVVLAGLVDPDQTVGQALGWLDFNEYGALTVPSWSEEASLRDLAEDDEEPPAGDYVDLVAVDRFTRGLPVDLSEAEYLTAVRRCHGKGLSNADIDALRRLPPRATEKTLNMLRKRYDRAGRDWPLPVSEPRRLSDDEVARLRQEYAAGGVTDLDLSLRCGVSRKAMSDLLSGRTYQSAGGPIRTRRSTASMDATRAAYARLNQAAFVSRTRQEKAA